MDCLQEHTTFLNELDLDNRVARGLGKLLSDNFPDVEVNKAGVPIAPIKRYSSDFNAIWELVTNLKQEGYRFYLHDNESDKWSAGFWVESPSDKMMSQYLHKNPCVAVCMAFLIIKEHVVLSNY